MTTTFLAYLLIVCYFVIERWLRQGTQALSLQIPDSDRESSRLLWAIGLFNLCLVLLAPVFNAYGIGNWNHFLMGWLGLLLMMGGIAVRYWAAKTLGKFYTRTLRILEEHRLVEQGLYRVIRHPGYLGTFLLEVGAGLAVMNWLILLVLVLTGMVVRAYRIHVEERMLEAEFGEEFQIYAKNTWKFFPLLY
jgi:protein-S-isoprenylcysteine O-methyltransferase Ste14